MTQNKDFNLTEMIKYFRETMKGILGERSIIDYCSHVNQIDILNGSNTGQWIFDAVENASANSSPVDEIMEKLNRLLEGSDKRDGLKSRYRCGFKKFLQCIIGVYHANTWLLIDEKDDFVYCKLVAKNALFPSEDVVADVIKGNLGTDDNVINKGNRFASWDYMTRARNNNVKKGQSYKDTDIASLKQEFPLVNDEIIADDNTYANRYLKTAVAESFRRKYNSSFFKTSLWSLFSGYEVCHVWDKPNDRRYYASIANLVLVPRALGQLTDHNDAVKKMLRYEVWKRFCFKPDFESEPQKPDNYDELIWR